MAKKKQDLETLRSNLEASKKSLWRSRKGTTYSVYKSAFFAMKNWEKKGARHEDTRVESKRKKCGLNI